MKRPDFPIGLHGQDGEGRADLAGGAAPFLPYSGKSEGAAIGQREAPELLAAVCLLLPFEEAVGRDKAAALPECLAEGLRPSGVLGPGINHAGADPGIGGPGRDKAPFHLTEAAFITDSGDDGNGIARDNFGARRLVRPVGEAEEVADLVERPGEAITAAPARLDDLLGNKPVVAVKLADLDRARQATAAIADEYGQQMLKALGFSLGGELPARRLNAAAAAAAPDEDAVGRELVGREKLQGFRFDDL